MKYVVVDTNEYLSCAIIEQHGRDATLIEKLRDGIRRADANLLVPNVIELELNRELRDRLAAFEQKVRQVQDKVKKGDLVRDFTDVERERLSKLMGTYIATRSQNARQVSTLLDSLFSSDRAVRIQTTGDVLARAYERGLQGRKPFTWERENPQPLNADCVIIETVRAYLQVLETRGATISPSHLILCTAIHHHFAVHDSLQKLLVLADDHSQAFVVSELGREYLDHVVRPMRLGWHPPGYFGL
jgi:hypothetical protein